jgi:DinB superfamily
MTYMETLADQAEWAARNTVYNLDFIPADKLDWKPAPSANSALEVVSHMIRVLKALGALIRDGGYNPPNFTPVTGLEEANRLLLDAARQYAETVRGVHPQDMDKMLDVPFGTFPLARVASFQ